MSHTIRQAGLDDLEAIVEFNRQLALETEGLVLEPTVLRQGVSAALHDPAKGFYTLAEQDGQPIGQTLITLEWSDWRNGYFWWVQSVFVDVDHRRKGVFRSLFDHLCRLAAADRQVIGVRLYVKKGNARGREVYHRLGLEEEGYELLGLYPLPGRDSAYERLD